MTYGPSSIPTAEILLDTIAESFPGWRVILIAAPDLPQGGGHGGILCVLQGHPIQAPFDAVHRVQPPTQEPLPFPCSSKLVEAYKSALLENLSYEG